MNYLRGQEVVVKDYRGRALVRRVWRDLGETVEITSEAVFRMLEKGQSDLWPIRVPKSDVSVRRNRGTK